ncbi:MAG TPA: amidohydrolase family protein [Longimicrobium sp.]|nr:amidohydrolase family protein [Longimicrobium sp.]
MIIDCHTHLNRYTPDVPESLAARHRLLREEMDAHGVAYALVISSYDVTPARPPTDEVLAQVADDPKIGVVAAATGAMIESGDFSALRRTLEGGRIKALKLYPGYVPIALTDPRVAPVYALAAEFGLPVMIHTGDTYDRSSKVKYAHPLVIDELAVDHRDVTFVMAHVGNPWFMDAAEVLYKNDNVYADVSGLTLGNFKPRYAAFARARLNDVIAFVNDPTRLMFGTDWPISELASYLEFVATLDVTDEEREGLMWRNAARVFRIEVGGEGGADAGGA